MSKKARKIFYEKRKNKKMGELKNILGEIKAPKKKHKTQEKTLLQKGYKQSRIDEIMKIHRQKQDIFANLSEEEKKQVEKLAKKVFFNQE